MLSSIRRWIAPDVHDARSSAVLYIETAAVDGYIVHHWVPVGSAADPIPGAAHLLEHLLSAAGKSYGTAPTALYSANAFTSFFWTRFDAKVAQGRLIEAIDQLRLLRELRNPSPKLIETEKSITRQEIYQYRSAFAELEQHRAFDAQLFSNSFLERWPMGTIEGIEALTERGLNEFHRQQYSAARTLTVILGNHAGPIVERQLRSQYRSARIGSLSLHAEPERQKRGLRGSPSWLALEGEPPATTGFLEMTAPVPSLQRERVLHKMLAQPSAEEAAQPAMRSILAGFLASRLPGSPHHELVDKSRLAAKLEIWLEPFPNNLLRMTTDALAAGEVSGEELSRGLQQYFDGFLRTGLDPATFGRLRDREIKLLDNRAESSRDFAVALGEEILLCGYDIAVDRRDTLRRLTSDGINAWLATIGKPLRAGALILKPEAAT
ncbi:insulinase family protein [Mesorhizobium sp.]|uniref:M16 family metallopeptidase n=1 Tax=Mesorhizobium sp. TaxID=1871066 RepID=UPI000FE67986|nr:insulinase family protein [Mesorhizobium sp.]RWB57235.1 MAG: insulinase family protein [Mesorhizobium sp.]TKB17422.1 MAG: insulinase family protein [Mesorhizobium sp.]